MHTAGLRLEAAWICPRKGHLKCLQLRQSCKGNMLLSRLMLSLLVQTHPRGLAGIRQQSIGLQFRAAHSYFIRQRIGTGHLTTGHLLLAASCYGQPRATAALQQGRPSLACTCAPVMWHSVLATLQSTARPNWHLHHLACQALICTPPRTSANSHTAQSAQQSADTALLTSLSYCQTPSLIITAHSHPPHVPQASAARGPALEREAHVAPLPHPLPGCWPRQPRLARITPLARLQLRLSRPCWPGAQAACCSRAAWYVLSQNAC